MADVTYKIIIEGSGGDGGGSKPRSVAVTPGGDEVSPGKNKKSNIYDTTKAVMNFAPVALALKYTNKMITTEMSRVALRSGRSTYQEQLNYTYSTLIKGAAIAGSLAAGVINPAFAVGGVISVVDMIIDYRTAADNIRIENSLERVSINLANTRAASGGSRNSN